MAEKEVGPIESVEKPKSNFVKEVHLHRCEKSYLSDEEVQRGRRGPYHHQERNKVMCKSKEMVMGFFLIGY